MSRTIIRSYCQMVMNWVKEETPTSPIVGNHLYFKHHVHMTMYEVSRPCLSEGMFPRDSSLNTSLSRKWE